MLTFRRTYGMQPLTACLPGLAAASSGRQTFAPGPVWQGSTRQPVSWQPLPKRQAVKLWHRARDFERRSRLPGRQDGALGRNGLAVLHALVFDFLNFASGRLDPAIATIARAAAISARSAARGLAKLKAAGVLHWLRRCTAAMEDGRYTLRQDSNAYALLPVSQWRGYTPPPDEPAAPWPEAWGAAPALPPVVEAAAMAQRRGDSPAIVLRELEGDPGDVLAAALARLGRTLKAGQTS